MRKLIFLPALVLLLLFSSAGFSVARANVGVGVSGGTLGIGAEASAGLTDYLGVRLGASYLSFSFNSTISYIDYDMEPEFTNGSLLLDWYPLGGAFRITGGIYMGDNTISLTGTARTDLIPDDFSALAPLADSIGIHGNVEYNSVCPYVGIGWNSKNDQTPGWGVAFDLGILFMGKPSVTDIYATGPLSDQPLVAEFLEQESLKIEDDLENFQYYPVATLRLSYYF
jgi:hypothetical protein